MTDKKQVKNKPKSIWEDICSMCSEMYQENLKILDYYYSTSQLKKHFFNIPFITFPVKDIDNDNQQVVYTIKQYAKKNGCKTHKDIYNFYASYWTDVLVDERYQSEKYVLRDYYYIQKQWTPRCQSV